jgi:hypothetical protein
MKRFLEKASKGFIGKPVQSPVAKPPVAANTGTGTTRGLQPKYIVPAVPHPRPHDHIALLVTKEGLLLRPYVAGINHPVSHVRIAWGKAVSVGEVAGDGESGAADWKDCVIVYGIVGVLELFSGMVLPSDDVPACGLSITAVSYRFIFISYHIKV